MSNLSISTSSDANVFCRCGVNAELKISWTQLNTGHRFFCCKNTKRRAGKSTPSIASGSNSSLL
ncbi:hypothetical protein H5410_034792 [Solanum commersonii]|uniref:Uncharacterized protein n=1 Tax=Solanum commersonii TaxID=4109 RepID=A0A9J5YX10_SOLCO|nr:hypothetical protein H5410_034792 [Solanum commersonii]